MIISSFATLILCIGFSSLVVVTMTFRTVLNRLIVVRIFVLFIILEVRGDSVFYIVDIWDLSFLRSRKFLFITSY